jgi:hypothetical protein
VENWYIFLGACGICYRFSQSILIHDKKAETIIKCLFTDWISLFGAPKQFLSDNGGEFNNDEMRGVADSFAIKLGCTAAKAPWSNEVCEYLNYILGLSVQMGLNDTQCELSVALSWAISAQNAQQNCHGYLPNQLVFGTNSSFPSVYDRRLPSIENRAPYKMVANNLNAVHASQVDFKH